MFNSSPNFVAMTAYINGGTSFSSGNYLNDNIASAGLNNRPVFIDRMLDQKDAGYHYFSGHVGIVLEYNAELSLSTINSIRAQLKDYATKKSLAYSAMP